MHPLQSCYSNMVEPRVYTTNLHCMVPQKKRRTIILEKLLSDGKDLQYEKKGRI